MNNTDQTHRKAIIGNPKSSFWLYDSKTGFDLTHPATPTSPTPSNTRTIETTTLPVKIATAKSALVIIDMQNFFLSTDLGRPSDSKGLKAQEQLLEFAIPAARKAGIQVIWLNWGLTQEEIDAMPPATLRAFGFETLTASDFESYESVSPEQRKAAIDSHGVNEGCDSFPPDSVVETSGRSARIYKGLGSEIGKVKLSSGESVDGGRLLMRDTWNASMTTPLLDAYKSSLKDSLPDVWVHKNRMSGLWGVSTPGTEYLQEKGLTTLFFAGVNTDQCVSGSLTDAFTKGYDCILLSDGCGTTSPASAQEGIEFNCARTWGFTTTCEKFKAGCEKA